MKELLKLLDASVPCDSRTDDKTRRLEEVLVARKREIANAMITLAERFAQTQTVYLGGKHSGPGKVSKAAALAAVIEFLDVLFELPLRHPLKDLLHDLVHGARSPTKHAADEKALCIAAIDVLIAGGMKPEKALKEVSDATGGKFSKDYLEGHRKNMKRDESRVNREMYDTLFGGIRQDFRQSGIELDSAEARRLCLDAVRELTRGKK
jgi:hypothetical protein